MQIYDACYFTIDDQLTLYEGLTSKSKSVTLAWIGIAKFNNSNNDTINDPANDTVNDTVIDTKYVNSGLNIEQIAVRELLDKMLGLLAISDILHQSQYPYRLEYLGYYVCFSHSKEQVSCIISIHPSAIDSELKPINERIATRFYHCNEIAWLSSLSTSLLIPVECARSVLWMIKECFIKIKDENDNLMQGLKRDYSQIADILLKSDVHYLDRSLADKREWFLKSKYQNNHEFTYQLIATTSYSTTMNSENNHAIFYFKAFQTVFILNI